MNSKLNYLIVLVIIGLVIFRLSANESEKSTAVPKQTQVAGTKDTYIQYQPQTKSMGAVEVEVTPQQLSPSKEAIFTVGLNTHSVDLGYEYTQIATLTDDQGNTYAAQEWTGEQGGHHLSGNLIFQILNEDTRSVTLTLEGIDEVTSTFEWQLK